MSRATIEQGMAFQIQEHMHRIVEGDELIHRIALMKARDFATSLTTRTASQYALGYAIDARDFAGETVFQEMGIDRLETCVRHCRHLVQCAFSAEALERP
jgi:hypothetical protein